MKQKRIQIVRDFRALALDEETSVYYVAIPPHPQNVESSGICTSGDMGAVLAALCTDAAQMHHYGKCAHCDRMALAIRAAHDAFRKALGTDAGTCGDTRQ